MSAEQNKATIRRWVEAGWNGGNVDMADEFLTTNYMIHDPGAPGFPGGIPAFKQYVNTLRTGMPDIKITIDDLLADGDKLVWRFTARGTHTGPLMGIPPTGKSGVSTGIIISSFTPDGKLIEDWINWDTLGLLQQIGVIPTLA